MPKSSKINIDGNEITVLAQHLDDYISLTDMARSQLQDVVIIKWLSLKSTIEYLGEWEALYNPDFNYTEFGTIKNAAGSNNFVLSVKQWLESTNAMLIHQGLEQPERLTQLNAMVITQMTSLLQSKNIQKLK